MILDTSALVAVFLKEPGADELVAKLGAAETVAIGAPSLVEAGIVLTARLGDGAQALLSQFLTEFGIVTVPSVTSTGGRQSTRIDDSAKGGTRSDSISGTA